MSPVRRIWTGCLALGAGLIHLALVTGAPWPLATGAVAVGLVEVLWGVATFARSAPPAPRAMLIAALLPGIAWLALLVTGDRHLPAYPLATATALELALAVVLAVRMRRGPRPDAVSDGRPVRLLLGVAAGAVLLALVTTPALAATDAGSLAPAHDHLDFGPVHVH